jgi:hypothetical protein
MAAHLASAQAARRCGISRQLWFQLETGRTKRPSLSTPERYPEAPVCPLASPTCEKRRQSGWPAPRLTASAACVAFLQPVSLERSFAVLLYLCSAGMIAVPPAHQAGRIAVTVGVQGAVAEIPGQGI